MKLQTVALAAVAALSLGVPAALAADAVVAKLASPVATQQKVIAGGSIFNCEADVCVASSPAPRAQTASGCRELAKAVGAVTSYGSERRQLDEAKLASCNSAAK